MAEYEAVSWELERRGRRPPDFGGWIERARPKMRWDSPHFRAMQAVLDGVTRGEIKRALFNVAVRHGKTEHNTISYAVYRLELDASLPIFIGTHSEAQAKKLSREIRTLYIARGGSIGTVDTTLEWETAEGGGVRAFGAGSGTASVNAGLIIIDDPIGAREDAESKAHRDRIWGWITSDILVRAVPKTGVLFSMPRWHSDDPAGRMINEQGTSWHVVNLPGRAEENDPLGRKEGEPLWPQERGDDFLASQRIVMGEYNWASLMQCRPSPRGGGMFQWDWWRLLEAVPTAGPMVRYWDMAGTDVRGSNDPDYTAGVLSCRMTDGRTAVVDAARFRLSVAARDAAIIDVARRDIATYRGRVTWWFEKETGIAGSERTANLVRAVQNLGLAVSTEHATGKKEIRAEPWASKAEAGNVVLCPGEWRDPFRLEHAQFPTGAHDDTVDAAVGADAKLSVPLNTPTVHRVRY